MQGLTDIERDCVERAMAADMLLQVETWSEINSGSRNLEGLATVGARLAGAFADLPGELRMVEAAPVDAIDEAGRSFEIEHGRNLHLTVRPDAPVQLLFTGHMDTVFGVDHPFQALKWLEPGKVLNGPGVADMKGGIAVMLAALKAVEASPLAAQLGYEVVINSDEEVGSLGSAALIAQAAKGKRAALTYEPSALPDGTLAGARPGSGNFSFTVTGRSAHAGRNPEEGRNALVAAADLALRLKAAVGPGLSVNPAKIDGGGPNNVVPDLAVLRVNLRPATLDDQARAQQLIDSGVAAVAADHDVQIHVHGHFARPPKPVTPETEALFGLVQRAGADLGQTIGGNPTGGVCDGNNIAACGVPVIDTMGVRGGSIHSMEEYLIVESLAERAALSALTILRLAAGTHGSAA
jgi:glutamate carboxypeptidase